MGPRGAALVLSAAAARLASGDVRFSHGGKLPGMSHVGNAIGHGLSGGAGGGWSMGAVEGNESAGPLRCMEAFRAGLSTERGQSCPDECPLLAAVAGGHSCDFQCVEATGDACKAADPSRPIADLGRGLCRRCMADSCETCSRDGTERCATCISGFTLVDGRCDWDWAPTWITVCAILAAGMLTVLAWLVDLAMRPVVNSAALRHGLLQRSREKPRMPKRRGHDRELWPLDTNLLKRDVGGPGLLLSFEFQRFIIIWAATVGLGWVALGYAVDPELLQLGWHSAKNAMQNCVLVAFGHEMRKELMFAKTVFILGVYLFTFVCCIAVSVRHERMHLHMDETMLTHKDFCAVCRNLPRSVTGADRVEEELQQAIQEATGQPVVGVSVCWDIREVEEDIMGALHLDLAERAKDVDTTLDDDDDLEDDGDDNVGYDGSKNKDREDVSDSGDEASDTFDERGGEDRRACWAFQRVEDAIFSTATAQLLHSAQNDSGAQPSPRGLRDRQLRDILEGLRLGGQAYAVFETERARDRAVKAVEVSGFEFRGATVRMFEAHIEPSSVLWANAVRRGFRWTLRRTVTGLATILAALFVWFVAFYTPFAVYSMSFDYSFGREPGVVQNLAFSMVVVIGNAIMYLICALVAERMGFKYRDNREVCYMLLYGGACLCNVFLDMIVSSWMAYRIVLGNGMPTFQGIPIANVTSIGMLFETFAMQRSMGHALYEYAFPSTFLVPFVLEPIVTIYIPWKVMVWVVRSRRSISKHDAEFLLAPIDMDLSRYADVMLNVVLASVSFYFPGGITHRMFLALAASHCVIYAVDQYKVLRCTRACYFASNKVDWWAQWMLSIPCGAILSSAVFKANCEQSGFFGLCLKDYRLPALVAAVFVGHVALHTLTLFCVAPLLSRGRVGSSRTSYRIVASKIACSWFASNPTHCLRSKLFYGHDPPCVYLQAGKEHLLRRNESIGCFFEDAGAHGEDYDDVSPLLNTYAEVRKHLSGKGTWLADAGRSALPGGARAPRVPPQD